MCGIVGYCGPKKVIPILLKGLSRLEYRGYDSAGVACLHNGEVERWRAKGKLTHLEDEVGDALITPSNIGIGHTRWATHGGPTVANAHPHCDSTGELALVHNGIIENYHSLREELKAKGHTFTSETDTEVIAHLIEEHLDGDLFAAVLKAVAQLEGSYALAIMWKGMPDTLIAVRNHSPLVLGIGGEEGNFIASDTPALLSYTNRVIFLDDQEVAVITADSHKIYTTSGTPVEKEITTIDWNAAMAEKAGYKHFMLKEIYEQPQAIADTVRGRIDPESGIVTLPELNLSPAELAGIQRIILVACGTSWHSALVARYWLETYARVPAEVEIASEFRYRDLVLDESTLVITLSQSGETADTLAGLRIAKQHGAHTVTICNVVGSTMTREADGTVYTHAGPEIGVASTKAFTTQLAGLFLFTMHLAQQRGLMDADQSRTLGQEIRNISEVVAKVIPGLHDRIKVMIERFYESRDFLFVGRGLTYPIAMEGALKLKEISYIHAEGYASGELKHGPIALIDADMPVMAIAPQDTVYQKSISNIEEIKARNGRIILLGTKGDEHLKNITDDVLYLPEVSADMNPILYSIPAQLLSYEIAVRRGCDVDQPRNLAKSVTVE